MIRSLFFSGDKEIEIVGFKSRAIRMLIDYDDVDHNSVDKAVVKIVAALNAAKL